MTATGAEAGSDLAPGPAAAADGQRAEPSVAGVVPVRRRVVRVAFFLALAGLSALAAWLLLQHGVRTDAFPPFIDGAQRTEITRYSGPWLTAAAGMALVAALFLLFALIDLFRGSRRARGGAE